MTPLRMDHVGIVVDDLARAIDFFRELGLVSQGAGSVEGAWVDQVIGLRDVRADIAMLETPDGHARVELSTFHAPPHEGDRDLPSNTRGLRHLSFEVDDIDVLLARLGARGYGLVGDLVRYEDAYRLCYVRGPEGIIVELAERVR